MYHCTQRIFDGLFKLSGARNCDSILPLLQQIAFTFTNAESVRVFCGYKMTLNNYIIDLVIYKLTGTVLLIFKCSCITRKE